MELAVDDAIASVIAGVSLTNVPWETIVPEKTGQFLRWVSFKASVPALFFIHPDVL